MLIKFILFFILIAVYTDLIGFHTKPPFVIFMFVAPLLAFIFALKLKLLLSVESNTLLVHALDLKFMHDLQEGKMDNKN